jgi:Flp pilus assembly protein TadB
MDPFTHPVLRQHGPLVINITDPSRCYYCNTGPLTPENRFCPSCGFPQGGTEDEQKRYITNKRIQLANLDTTGQNVKKARNALFGAAVLYGLNYIVAGAQNAWSPLVLIEGLIVVGAFVGLGIYANRNAYAAALAGLIVFCTLIVGFAVIEPLTLISGIIWKVIILSALIYGLKAAREYKRLHAELSENKINL